jgi:hypothetical protein
MVNRKISLVTQLVTSYRKQDYAAPNYNDIGYLRWKEIKKQLKGQRNYKITNDAVQKKPHMKQET